MEDVEESDDGAGETLAQTMRSVAVGRGAGVGEVRGKAEQTHRLLNLGRSRARSMSSR